MYIYFYWSAHDDVSVQAFKSEASVVKHSFKKIGELVKIHQDERWKEDISQIENFLSKDKTLENAKRLIELYETHAKYNLKNTTFGHDIVKVKVQNG